VTDSLAQSVTVDSERLTEWVGDRLPGAGLLELTRIGEGVGVANALFVVSRGGAVVAAAPAGSRASAGRSGSWSDRLDIPGP
jgi:hypothetical protein